MHHSSTRVLFPLILTAALVTAQADTFVANPTMPRGGSMLFDPERGLVTVFESGADRTWEWNGSMFRLLAAYRHPGVGFADRDPRTRLVLTEDGSFDGANWTSWSPGPLSGIAFDRARSRLVGIDGFEVVEWDGGQWLRIRPPASPLSGPLCYDPDRSACVRFTGSALYRWTGVEWLTIDAQGPTDLRPESAVIAHDPRNNRLVTMARTLANGSATWTFGNGLWTNLAMPAAMTWQYGNLVHDGVGMLASVATTSSIGWWRLDGLTWRDLGLAEPLPRTGPSLAASPTGVLFFGSMASTQSAADTTWRYDNGWVRLPSTNVPPARRDAALAWSPINNGFLLQGGNVQGQPLTDTWLWNGTDWARQQPTRFPSNTLALTTDPAGGVIGLMRNLNRSEEPQWQWNGSNWLATAGEDSWPHLADTTVTLDPVRNVVVAAVSRSILEWDGTAWTDFGSLLPTFSLTAVFDPARGSVLFHGPGMFAEWRGGDIGLLNIANAGNTALLLAPDFVRRRLISPQHLQGPAWNGVTALLTDRPATVTRFGYGCSRTGAPGLTTVGRPIPGSSAFALDATTHTPNSPCGLVLGLSSQPLHLGSGCVIWSTTLSTHLLAADRSGHARLALPIPATASLRGLAVLAQTLAMDPPASPLGTLTLSDGLRFAIGD